MKTAQIVSASAILMSMVLVPSLAFATDMNPNTSPVHVPGTVDSIKPAQVIDTPTPAPTPKPAMDIACVQKAVDAREGALGDAFTAFSGAESHALAGRKSALNTAWGLTDAKARRTAREGAWAEFRAGNKAAYTALRTSRRAAWSTFKTAAPVVETAQSEGAGSLGL
jgi:hypothetical protein